MINSFFRGASAPFFMRLILSASVLMLAMASCQSQKEVVEETAKGMDLVGQKWELISTGGEPIKTSMFTNGIPFIELKEDKTLSGFTGCNSFMGKYSNDGALKLTPGAMTKMYCPNIPENEFIKLLTEVNGLNFVDEELQLVNGQNELLRFKAVNE